jgi:thymidylate synthase ThyX
MTEFTPEEEKILAPFFTNLDKPIFALKNLPEVVKGALFSRYSRTAKSLRRVLLDEFINAPEMGFEAIVGHQQERGVSDVVAIKKAEEFYDRVLVGYGDDSVAELAGVHIACEQVSNIATKALQDSRIGLSPLEKSTRYVYFDEKVNGEYLYLREPTLMASHQADLYVATCEKLFSTYAKLIPKVSAYVIERFPQETEVSDRAYKSTVRAKTCDLLRGLLPASTITNTGIYGNGRSFEYLLTKMYSSDLAEIRNISGAMNEELAKVIPSFVKRANNAYGVQQQAYWKAIRRNLRHAAKQNKAAASFSKEVTLIDYDANAEERIIAAALYPHSHDSMADLRQKAAAMPAHERATVIKTYVGERANRRNKPGRAFELPRYTFDLCCNYGAYRDLQRHRMLTQERQELTTRLGYDLPSELVDAGFDAEFNDCMAVAANAYDEIVKSHASEAQYAVPMAYRVRWYADLNLREAFHLLELRSTPQGHPDYRRMAQKMHAEIGKVHPAFANYMTFVDHSASPTLERLESEKKIDKKLAEMDKKYGGH